MKLPIKPTEITCEECDREMYAWASPNDNASGYHCDGCGWIIYDDELEEDE